MNQNYERESIWDFVLGWLVAFLAAAFAFAFLLVAYSRPEAGQFKQFAFFLVIYLIIAAFQSAVSIAFVVSILRGRRLSVVELPLLKGAIIGFLVAVAPWVLLLWSNSDFSFQIGQDVLSVVDLGGEMFMIGLCGAIAALAFCLSVRKRVLGSVRSEHD